MSEKYTMEHVEAMSPVKMRRILRAHFTKLLEKGFTQKQILERTSKIQTAEQVVEYLNEEIK